MKLEKTISGCTVALALCLSAAVAFGQAKAPAKPPAKAPTKAQGKAPSAAQGSMVRRDPFRPLIDPRAGDPRRPVEVIGPGLHNLPIAAAKLDGIVRSPNGMIVVISTPQQRVYFAREGAKLLDGTIERITMDAVIFRQQGKDPFGKTVDQQITRYLYPKAGE